MAGLPPKWFNIKRFKRSKKVNDKTNSNTESFRRKLLSTPPEFQHVKKDGKYKDLSSEERDKKIVDDLHNLIKTIITESKEISTQTGENLGTIDKMKRYRLGEREKSFLRNIIIALIAIPSQHFLPEIISYCLF